MVTECTGLFSKLLGNPFSLWNGIHPSPLTQADSAPYNSPKAFLRNSWWLAHASSLLPLLYAVVARLHRSQDSCYWSQKTRQKIVANQHSNPQTCYRGISAANLHVSEHFSLVTANADTGLLSATVHCSSWILIAVTIPKFYYPTGYFQWGSPTSQVRRSIIQEETQFFKLSFKTLYSLKKTSIVLKLHSTPSSEHSWAMWCGHLNVGSVQPEPCWQA